MEVTLKESVSQRVKSYIETLDGAQAKDLYKLFIDQVEAGLIEAVLEHTEQNRSNAAQMLGMARGTLIKKIKELNIQHNTIETYY